MITKSDAEAMQCLCARRRSSAAAVRDTRAQAGVSRTLPRFSGWLSVKYCCDEPGREPFVLQHPLVDAQGMIFATTLKAQHVGQVPSEIAV